MIKCQVGVSRISIHALHEESDEHLIDAVTRAVIFQSTLSMRRATHRCDRQGGQRAISIHALHEESDVPDIVAMTAELFQSTLSMRRATGRW